MQITIDCKFDEINRNLEDVLKFAHNLYKISN